MDEKMVSTMNEQGEQVTEQQEPTQATRTAEDYEAEIAQLKRDNQKLKQANTTTSADVSRYKKELQARMTEQERLEAERAERDAAREARIAELEHNERVSKYSAKMMGYGMDANTASKLADILPAEVPDEYFAAQADFVEALKRNIRAELLKEQPGLTPGVPPSAQTVENKMIADFRKAAGLK